MAWPLLAIRCNLWKIYCRKIKLSDRAAGLFDQCPKLPRWMLQDCGVVLIQARRRRTAGGSEITGLAIFSMRVSIGSLSLSLSLPLSLSPSLARARLTSGRLRDCRQILSARFDLR